jgi:predicted TIM-barrel fold metal-dependent hydrolase
MTKPSRGPRATTTRPKIAPPPGAGDCHFHIFRPYDRFPLSGRRGYTPLPATVERYLAMSEAIGVERTVIVQPSVYGADNACTLCGFPAG